MTAQCCGRESRAAPKLADQAVSRTRRVRDIGAFLGDPTVVPTVICPGTRTIRPIGNGPLARIELHITVASMKTMKNMWLKIGALVALGPNVIYAIAERRPSPWRCC
jgi:hypothetical protein